MCKMEGKTDLESSILLRLVMRCELKGDDSELFEAEAPM